MIQFQNGASVESLRGLAIDRETVESRNALEPSFRASAGRGPLTGDFYPPPVPLAEAGGLSSWTS
jgi:hypothetical protein